MEYEVAGERERERDLSKHFEIEAANGVVLEIKMLCGCLEFMFRSVSEKHSYNLWNHWVTS